MSAMEKTSPVMSVIVPVYNGAGYLDRCLQEIRGQEGIGRKWIELIVVDDGSEDGSGNAASGLADRIIRLERNSGAAAARNAGARAARADILVFVDADVVLEPGALSRFKELFENEPEISAAVGRYTELPACPGFINLYHNLFTRVHHDMSPKDMDWFWGALGAVRKEAFGRAGGFDERYLGASAEDMELGIALSRTGHRIRYLPEAEGAHAHDFTLSGMLANDYKKAVLGVKLMLMGGLPSRAPGFASNREHLFLPGMLVLLTVAAIIDCSLKLNPALDLLLYAVTILPIWLLDLGPFHLCLAKHFPGWKIIPARLVYLIQMAVVYAGAAMGAAGWLLGREPYGRPGWM